MKPLDRILETARARQAHIILSEGRDPRVREAAARIVAEGLARITLMDGEAPGAATIDSATAPDLPQLAAAFHELRKGKGLTPEAALLTPHALVGTADEIVDQLVARRERWGLSYIGINADSLDAMAPVIARLAGT